MRDILATLSRWEADGRRAAIASVVERRGSAPRDPGASLALNDLGEIAGSVTGGCVEPSVIREAQEVLDGGPARLREYGIADDTAFEVGLACGGTVVILVATLDLSLVPALAGAVESDRAVALTMVASGDRLGAQELHEPPAGPLRLRRDRPRRCPRTRRPTARLPRHRLRRARRLRHARALPGGGRARR